MGELLKLVLRLSLSGSALMLFLLLLRRLLKKRIPSSFYYYAWLIVLLRFVLPLPGLLPGVGAPQPATAEPAAVEAPPPAAEQDRARISDSPRVTWDPQSPVRIAPAPAAAGESAAEENGADVPPLSETAGRLLRSWSFWGAVWLTGAGLSALWTVCGYFRFRRGLAGTLRPALPAEREVLLRLQPEGGPALYRSRAVNTPMLLGLLRPIIVLPERAYSREMLEGILRHELTHYRRGDLAYKWFSAAVIDLHWFNPLPRLCRREIDRACELSCDERLLRRMGREEKQRYGELLLSLAAERSLPRSVVAMSFATEKRNLKERLLQIMTYRKAGKASLAMMMIVLLLLTGCAGALGPAARDSAPAAEAETAGESAAEAGAEAAAPEEESGAAAGEEADAALQAAAEEAARLGMDPRGERVFVAGVDEFVAAIGPDRLLVLPEGDFDLSGASTYGRDTGNEYCRWSEVYDGYELEINGVSNLTVIGEGVGKTRILAEPRYANVLSFRDGCQGVSLVRFTAGHTTEPGYCAGGVLSFTDCGGIGIESCDLFGCGVLGISAMNCRQLIANDTVIRECSYGAVSAAYCYDVRFTGGAIRDCGIKAGYTAFDLLDVTACTGFVVYNTEIVGSHAQTLLHSSGSKGVELRGCEVHDNIIGDWISEGESVPSSWGAVFQVSAPAPVVDGCSFAGNELASGWYFNDEGQFSGRCVDGEGAELTGEDLEAMELRPYEGEYGGPVVSEVPAPEGELNADGLMEYHVSTADEFLAAIGSDTLIVLDKGLYDFSAASSYGGYGGPGYYWMDTYDGPGLVIAGVRNLHIRGAGKELTTLQATPRYAEVIFFENCENVSLTGLTAGHLKEAPGSCCGDVLEFSNCTDVWVENCGLFGCGVNGIMATGCSGLNVADTDLYECSSYGAYVTGCSAVFFQNCSVRDCAEGGFYAYDCAGLRLDGVSFRGCGPAPGSETLKQFGADQNPYAAVLIYNCSDLSIDGCRADGCSFDGVLMNYYACRNAQINGEPVRKSRTAF